MLTRRQLLAGAGAAAGLAALGSIAGCGQGRATAPARPGPSSTSPPASPGPGPRYSVVVVLVDDMRHDYLGLLSVFADGPWIDCTAAAAQTPLCAPSRASMLTASDAWRTPVVGNETAAETARIEHDTFATRMGPAGYRMALVGKYQNQFPFGLGADHVPPGWTDWNAIGSAAWNPGGQHETDHCFQWASEFVASVGADQPFVLWVAPELPHDPFTPPARYVRASVTVPPEPPSVDEADVSTKPLFVRQKPRLTPTELATFREDRRLQALDMLAIDDGLHQLVGALTAAGRLDSTVVIFTSDNSLELGEHRLANKGFPYEESVHVPFVVHWPGVARRREDHALSLVDVPATMCAIAGVPSPGPDGIDLSPLLRDGTPVREGAYLTPPDNHFWDGVRTSRYKYVEYEGGFHELYDLAADPYELINLAGHPDQTEVQAHLRDLLQSLRP